MPSNSTDTVAVVPELENDTKTGTKTREQLHAEAQPIANIWEKPKTWKGYIWDALGTFISIDEARSSLIAFIYADKPKAERRFLLKLDLTLLTVTCLGTFIRTLDQNNVVSRSSLTHRDLANPSDDLPPSLAFTISSASFSYLFYSSSEQCLPVGHVRRARTPLFVSAD